MKKVKAVRIKKESGLAGVAQAPRGYKLKLEGEEIGMVFPYKEDAWSRNWIGWRFQLYRSSIFGYGRSLKIWPLTHEGMDECRDSAIAYIEAKLKEMK